jgi:hypothetical protein
LAVKPDQETPVTYETMEEVEAAIAERALPLKRLTPLLLELEAERRKTNGVVTDGPETCRPLARSSNNG